MEGDPIELSLSDYGQLGSLEEYLRLTTPSVVVTRVPGRPGHGEQGALDMLTALAEHGHRRAGQGAAGVLAVAQARHVGRHEVAGQASTAMRWEIGEAVCKTAPFFSPTSDLAHQNG